MRRSISIFLFLALILQSFTSFSTPLVFAKEVKAAKKESKPQQNKKLTPENIEKEAYRIWLAYFRERRQGKELSIPVLNVPPNIDAKEFNRVKSLWEQAQRRAYLAVEQEAIDKLWSDWYKAQREGIFLPSPTLKINADPEETKQVSEIWARARIKAYIESFRLEEQASKSRTPQVPQSKNLLVTDQQISNSVDSKQTPEPDEAILASQPKPPSPLPANNSLVFNNRPKGIAGLISGQIANSMQSSGYKTVVNTEVAGRSSYTEPATNLVNPVSPAKNKRTIGSREDAIKAATTTGSTIYEYDRVGNISRVTLPNGITTSYIYNSLNRLTNVKVEKADGTLIASYDYTLGSSGNKLSVRELSGRSVQWSYDALYRLKSEIIAGSSNPSTNGTVNYSHDGVGNRLERNSLVSAVPVQQFSYDNNDRLTTDTYDANGNTTHSGNRDYTYDVGNHITKVTDSGSNLKILYLYDVDGNRVSKTVGITNNSGFYITDPVITQYLVDTNSPTGYAQVVEELQNGQVVKRYTYGNGLAPISMAQLINGQWVTSFFITDGQGSVRFLTDINGNVTDSFDYDGFGNLINRTGSTPNTRLYKGEDYDPDLGMYNLRARFMNPNTGRFFTMDSDEGDNEDPLSLHKYTYAQNNPTNKFDPTGRFGVDFAIGNNFRFAFATAATFGKINNSRKFVFSQSTPFPPLEGEHFVLAHEAIFNAVVVTATRPMCDQALREYGTPSLFTNAAAIFNQENKVFDGSTSTAFYTGDQKLIKDVLDFNHSSIAFAITPTLKSDLREDFDPPIMFLGKYFFNRNNFSDEKRDLEFRTTVILHESVHFFGYRPHTKYGGTKALNKLILTPCFPGYKNPAL
jgi:RHS repeat-associated protein